MTSDPSADCANDDADDTMGCAIDDDDDDAGAVKRGHLAMHPLAANEWLALLILQKLAHAGHVQALGKLALLNRAFFAAFKSDLVWEQLLPPASHLDLVFAECDDAHLLHCYRNNTLSKQALFQRLTQSIALAGGLKKFWLDRATGGECYMISASALDIERGSDPLHWQWLPCGGAWFPVVAVLRSVQRFEVKGKFWQVLRPGSYTLSFRIQIHSSLTWRCWPVRLSLQNLPDGHNAVRLGVLFHSPFPRSDPPLISPPFSQEGQPTSNGAQHSNFKYYEWIDCDVGEFTVEENEDSPIEVDFSMREVDFPEVKCDLLLDGVFIRPTRVVNAREGPTICVGSMLGCGDYDNVTMGDFVDE